MAYLASSERLNGYEGALAAAGVLPELVRISVGIEDADDVIYDLDRALG